MKSKVSMKPFLWLIVLIMSLLVTTVETFTISKPTNTLRPRTAATTALLDTTRTCRALTNWSPTSDATSCMALYGKGADDDSDKDIVDNFDAEGFGGYLAPYAIALLASLVVTAAFFKFVLLDY